MANGSNSLAHGVERRAQSHGSVKKSLLVAFPRPTLGQESEIVRRTVEVVIGGEHQGQEMGLFGDEEYARL